MNEWRFLGRHHNDQVFLLAAEDGCPEADTQGVPVADMRGVPVGGQTARKDRA